MFKEWPHPDDKQRQELSRELKLSPRQIKFWFQNKRTQMKVKGKPYMINKYLAAMAERKDLCLSVCLSVLETLICLHIDWSVWI